MATTLHPLEVKSVEKETSSCVSVSFSIPDDLKTEFEFIPGQYLTLESEIFGEKVRRAYSLCSAPLEKEWKVAIKKVPEGKFSTFANEALMAGDVVHVMPPQGNFKLSADSNAENHFVGFAAGSGITPILSMIKSALWETENSSFTLIYGNKGLSDIIFFEELEALKNKFLGRLTVHHVFSREIMDADINSGRIDKEKLLQFANGLIDFNTISEVFICGPLGMTEMLRDELPALGVAKESVHFELFNTEGAENHKEFAPNISAEEAGQTAQVSITLDGKTAEFPLAYGGKNILDAALQQGADLPFACKGGVCSTCRAKLVEGKVEMEVNYALEQDEIDRGFILTCQAHPRTDIIKVDFDQT